MTQPGKRSCGSTVNATSAVPQQQQPVITCTKSGRRFLADTGAQVSVIHAIWMNKRAGSTCQPLQAANSTPILTFGARIVPLHFG